MHVKIQLSSICLKLRFTCMHVTTVLTTCESLWPVHYCQTSTTVEYCILDRANQRVLSKQNRKRCVRATLLHVLQLFVEALVVYFRVNDALKQLGHETKELNVPSKFGRLSLLAVEQNL